MMRRSMERAAVPDAKDLEHQRMVIDRELEHSGLSERNRKTLRECYVQHNTVASAAYKLDMDAQVVHMWYYRMSMADIRDAFQSYLNAEV